MDQTRAWFDDPSVQRVQDAWRRSPAVKALAIHPRILTALRTVYGRDPFPFQTLSFQVGTEQPKHSDAIHFHSDPPLFMCGVWIALEDVALDAGALVYWPGSHKLPILTMRGAGLNRPDPEPADYDRLYQPALDARIDASGIAPEHAVVRKGQAFVWAANLVHGGSPITREGATRRSLVVHFYFEGCVYYTPMISDPEAGRLAVRLPADVRTGVGCGPVGMDVGSAFGPASSRRRFCGACCAARSPRVKGADPSLSAPYLSKARPTHSARSSPSRLGARFGRSLVREA